VAVGNDGRPGGLDPAVGALDVCDADHIDVTVEWIGDAAHMAADWGRVEIDGQPTADLRDTRAVQIEALVVGDRLLVVGADDAAPAAVLDLGAASSLFPRKWWESPQLRVGA
jgi:hypothetical protein